MINGDDILTDMKAQIDEYKKQYDEISKEIERTGSEYQAKIDALQQERLKLVNEGNAKLEQLKLQREQIRGMHASLYTQYNKYIKPKENVNVGEVNVNKKEVVENNNEKDAVVNKPKATKKKDEKQADSLSDVEKETLAKIVNKKVTPIKSLSGDTNNEIPEYLIDEYKK